MADAVRVGLVQSLARQGGNVTGVATLVPGGFMAKQLELLKEAVPGASRVATLGNPTNDVYRVTFPVEIPPTARALGLRLQVLEVDRRGQPAPPEVQTVRTWLDNWTGLGHVVTGMQRQGYDLPSFEHQEKVTVR